MVTRLLLPVLCASLVATAQPDGGPRRSTPDAGTRGTTVPDRMAPPAGGPELPAPRTQTSNPLGTGSETPAPSRAPSTGTPPRRPAPEVPPRTQPPSPTPR